MATMGSMGSISEVLSSDSETEYNTERDEPGTSASSNKTVPQKRRRVQAYRTSWESQFTWLKPVKDKFTQAQCVACGYVFQADLGIIKRHANCLKHKVNERKMRCQPKMTEVNGNRKLLDNQIKRAEIKLCGFLAEHNVAFLAIDHLVPLVQECFPDSAIAKGVQLARTKAVGVTKNIIGEHEFQGLIALLQNGKFSLLVDESTDISSTKTMAICVRFYSPDYQAIKTQFLSLLQVFSKDDPEVAQSGATAEKIYNDLVNFLEKSNIPLINLIGFGSDGCNVMFGKRNSVVSRFEENFPGIFTFKCICHSLHLCASEACKILPRETEGMARDIYSFFNHSSKRQAQLGEFQDFCNVEPHKILRPAQTRWLSLTQVVNRIKNQWGALELYFRHNFTEHRLVQSEQILNALTNPENKLFYYFLDWILPKFSQTNAYFQSEKVVLTHIHKKISCLYKELLLIYMNPSYINRTNLNDIDPELKEHFIPVKNIHLGFDVLKNMEQLNEIQKNDFLFRIQRFLIISCIQIKKRYDFSNPLLSQLDIFEPTYRNRPMDLYQVLEICGRLYNNENAQKIDDEWRALIISEDDRHFRDLEIDRYWAEIINIKDHQGKQPYKHIAAFVLNILCFPHSNAEVERVFSKVNLVKTKTRNRLVTETVGGLLLASQAVKKEKNCVKFEPTQKMLSSMRKDVIYLKNNESESLDLDVIFEH